jgi:Fe-S cluster assembly protein SufD
MNVETRDRFVADFSRVATRLPGARLPWLSQARRAALRRFAAVGFPTTRDEEWKYTNVAAIEERPFIALPEDVNSLTKAQVDAMALGGIPGHLLVFVNGRYSPALSAVGRLPAGVILSNVADVLERAPDALEALLTKDGQDGSQSAFALLNSAFMADGVYLHLRRGTALDAPVHALFIASSIEAQIHPRNLILAESNTQATLIEHYVGPDGAAYLTNAVTQIVAGDNAAIEHYTLQRQGRAAFHIAGIHAAQGRGSRYTSHSIALGAALARNDITTRFDAEGCEATLNGLYLIDGRQHVDHHTRIDHARPNGTSREYYRGVLDGAARGVFNGKVVVHPGAQRTDAHQANHNLLLSKEAEVDTKPQLEIYADDVKCTHGATVGQLDDAQIFYLRSRGVDEAIARSLLTYAFAHDVIERIRVAALRDRLTEVLLARLPHGDRIRELA